MASRMNSFLGDSPLRVLVRLVVLSLIVGFVMRWTGIYPLDVLDWVVVNVRSAWEYGFEAFDDIIQYLLLGAMVVVPLFLISRLLRSRSNDG